MAAPQAPGTEVEEATLENLTKVFRRNVEWRRPLDVRSVRNLLMYAGQQWVVLRGDKLFMPPVGQDDQKFYVHLNRMNRAIRSEYARLCEQRPQYHAAKSALMPTVAVWPAKQALQYIVREADAWGAYRSSVFWPLCCYVGWISCEYNPKLGPTRKVSLAENPDLLDNPELLQRAVREALDPAALPAEIGVPSGAVTATPWSYFDVYPQAYVSCEDEIGHVFLTRWMRPEDVERLWGYKAQASQSPIHHGGHFMMDIGYDLGLSYLNLYLPAGVINTVPTARRQMTMVVEYREAGGPMMPTSGGRRVLFIPGQAVLDEMPNPHPSGKLGLHMVSHMKMPGALYGTCLAELLAHPQTVLNVQLSRYFETLARCGGPAFVYPENGIDDDMLPRGRPNEHVPIKTGYTRDQVGYEVVPPSIARQYLDAVKLLIQNMDELAGQLHRVEVPAQTRSGDMVRALQQPDETLRIPILADHQQLHERVATDLYELFRAHAEEGTIIEITGGGATDALRLRAEDLEHSPRIRVECSMGLPTDMIARRTAIQQLVQVGILKPEQAMRYLEFANEDELWHELDIDRRSAEAEHMRLYQGQPVEVRPDVDNHVIHIAVHNLERKQPSFPTDVPVEIQQIWTAHVAVHKEYVIPEQGLPGGFMPLQMAAQARGSSPDGAQTSESAPGEASPQGFAGGR